MTASPVDFTDDAVRAGLRGVLLAWFDARQRDLPWRRRRSLYGTWISEMMLQQTTVATVVPYWERFLARFPDVYALAAAPEAEVLAHWSGLGYYRRARQLHAAARQVVAEHGGAFPDDTEGWRALPGIGPYAAGAIASLGLGLPAAAVDANVRRVLGRWLGAACQPGAGSDRQVADLAGCLVRGDRPGAWNEALMELGALVCQPRGPRCEDCPVGAYCGARRLGIADSVAVPEARPAALPVQALLVAFLAEGRVWLEPPGGPLIRCDVGVAPAREALGKLHQGLLTLPTTAWYPRPEKSACDLLAALPAGWVDAAGFAGAGAPRAVGRFRHAITRYRLLVDVAAVGVTLPETPGPHRDIRAQGEISSRPGRWVSLAEAPGLNISQLARKALRCCGDARG